MTILKYFIDAPLVAMVNFCASLGALRAQTTSLLAKVENAAAHFGCHAIPFNVACGSGVTKGVTLPEILSTDLVLAALDEAQKK